MADCRFAIRRNAKFCQLLNKIWCNFIRKGPISSLFGRFYHYWAQGKGMEVMDWSYCGWGGGEKQKIAVSC